MSQFIVRLLTRLPTARHFFYAGGFELPQKFLSDVEATRVRGSGEQDYQFYMDEVLREGSYLACPWLPAARSKLEPCQRSTYLDMLASVAGEPQTSSLDPNFNAYMKLSDELQIKRLREYRKQKDLEQEVHASSLATLAEYPNSKLINGILQIANDFGYTPVQKLQSRANAVDLRCTVGGSAQLLIRLPDLHALKKHGNVAVQYFFTELPNEPFGLSSFVPGGHLYCSWNMNPKAIFFSFYVNCIFLSHLHSVE